MKSIREKVNTKLSKGYNLIQDVKYGIPYWYFENNEGHTSKYPYINDDIVYAELLDIPMTLRNYSIRRRYTPYINLSPSLTGGVFFLSKTQNIFKT